MGGFEVIALQGICASYFEKHVSPLISELKQAQEQLSSQVQKISVATDLKQAENVLAKFDALQADMAQKASIAKLEEVLAQRGLKSHNSEVSTEAPSTPQLEQWLSEAEAKCSAQITPLEERMAHMERTVKNHAAKIAQQKNLDEEIACKANVRDVPTLAQFQRLANTTEKKANSSKVPTLQQFQELEALVETKATANLVPTDAEVQELRSAMKKKANASSVPSAIEFQKFSADVQVQLEANKENVEKVLEQKADNDQVVRSSTVDNLRNVMERKLTFLASRIQKTSEIVEQGMANQQAMVCYVSPQGAWQPDVRNGVQGAWVLQPQAQGMGGDGYMMPAASWGEVPTAAPSSESTEPAPCGVP